MYNDPSNESSVILFSVVTYELLARHMFPELTTGWKEDLTGGQMRVVSFRDEKDTAGVKVGSLCRMLL